MTTVEDLVTRTQANLALLAGQGAQMYGEVVIMEKLRLSHDSFIISQFWDNITQWVTWTLDGSTGVVTALVDQADPPLRKFEDIQYVLHQQAPYPLRLMPHNMPPDLVSGGSTPSYIMRYNNPSKIFKVVPFTSEGEIRVRYRTRPNTWDMTTEVQLDDSLMIRAATFQYLVDDGTNPDASNTAGAALQDRINELDAQLSSARPMDEYSGPWGVFEWH